MLFSALVSFFAVQLLFPCVACAVSTSTLTPQTAAATSIGACTVTGIWLTFTLMFFAISVLMLETLTLIRLLAATCAKLNPTSNTHANSTLLVPNFMGHLLTEKWRDFSDFEKWHKIGFARCGGRMSFEKGVGPSHYHL